MGNQGRSRGSLQKLGRRVLITALSTILIQLQIITVFGYEVDDLREFSGEQRIKTEEYLKSNEDIVKMYDAHKIKKEESELLGYESLAIEIGKKRDELNLSRGELVKEIRSGMAQNTDASLLITKTDEIKKIDTMLIQDNMQIPEVTRDDVEINSQYAIAEEKIRIANESFELGEIGERMKSPVKDLFKIYYPYGEMKNPYNQDEVWRNNGVYLDLPKKGSEVRVQWNGTVKKVVTGDVTWGNYIVVQHGASLETSYSFMDTITVREGQELKQYDKLGTSLDKYLYFEVILDGAYVNPFKLYGSTGVNVYNTWVNNNPGILISDDKLGEVKNYVTITVDTTEKEKNNITTETEAIEGEDDIHVTIN